MNRSRVAYFPSGVLAYFPSGAPIYQPDADGVTIVRVLHAARDWWTLLGLL